MPEWPEMEHYKRMLNREIAGKTITGTDVQREKSINVPPGAFKQLAVGQQVAEVARRAKMLLFRLTNEHTMLLHLMLGGWMFYGTAEEKPDRTVQVMLEFGDYRLYFIGLRLGFLHIYNSAELEERLSDLGPDPYDPWLTTDRFISVLGRKRAPVKVLFTDQTVLSGIGNCYSDEICHFARIRPSRKPDSLGSADYQALYNGMHAVLRTALDYGGYMEEPFMTGDRITGGFDSRCKVYDREGEPCYRCGSPVRREEIASKKTFYCPECQL